MAILIALILAAGVAFFVWRARRGSSRPPTFLVAFFAEPRSLSIEHLRRVATELFERPFSLDPDAPESVTIDAGWGVIKLPDHTLRVFARSEPMNDALERIDWVKELRARNALRDHGGSIMVEYPRRPATVGEDEAYATLGRLLAALADDEETLLLDPFHDKFCILEAEHWNSLREGMVRELLDEMQYDGIGMVPEDDPEMTFAIELARRRWPEFVAAWHESSERDGFIIKAPFGEGENTEFMWVQPTVIDEDRLEGELLSEPRLMARPRKGDRVTVANDEVIDWIMRHDGEITGGYTEVVIRQRLGR